MGRRGPKKRKVGGRPPKTGEGLRVHPLVMIPVGLSVGWLVAGWAGAVLGGIIGVFLWRSRA